MTKEKYTIWDVIADAFTALCYLIFAFRIDSPFPGSGFGHINWDQARRTNKPTKKQNNNNK